MISDEFAFAFRELRDNWDDPWWWRHHLLEAVNNSVNAAVHQVAPGYDDAIAVMDEDWDNLIVLDACRADLFEAVADRDRFDRYERVTSLGSMTPEWTRRNFADRDCGDTVCVSANPYTALKAGDAFHRLKPVWASAFDEDAGTVRPEAVASTARETAADYPHKRLVVHFVQPHHPFIADEDVAAVSEWSVESLTDDEHPAHPHDPFEAYSMGRLDRERLWTAYADTLSLVLDRALALAADLPGWTVVTADHGNMVGERGWPIPMPVYGHHARLRYPELVEVPWAVVESDDRRSVTADGTEDARVADEQVEDRLRHLGYV